LAPNSNFLVVIEEPTTPLLMGLFLCVDP